jgi:hypothetical protein
MAYSFSNSPHHLRCPIRKKLISSMVCHTCANHIKVQYKSENPPELQCARYEWDLDEIDEELESDPFDP